MSEYTPEYWIKCLRDPGWVGRNAFHVQIADSFQEVVDALKEAQGGGDSGVAPRSKMVVMLDAAEVNGLPDRVRQYIYDLETNADPAGTVQDLALLKDQTKQLDAMIARLKKELKDTQELLNRRETTFTRERSENRQLRLGVSTEVAPVADMRTMMPAFLKALTGNPDTLNFEKTLEGLSAVKNVEDIQIFLGKLLEPIIEATLIEQEDENAGDD